MSLGCSVMTCDEAEQQHTVVFHKWRWSCLYRPSKGIAVDTQADNDVVHLGRFRQADGLAHQALHACPSRQMLPLDLLRIPLAWAADRPQGLDRPARRRLGVVPARSSSGPPSTPSHTMAISAHRAKKVKGGRFLCWRGWKACIKSTFCMAFSATLQAGYNPLQTV